MEEQGNLPYPYEFKDIRLDEQALLKYLHKSRVMKYCRVGPKGYLVTNSFKKDAVNIYNMPPKPDDVYVVSFQRSGTTWTQELVWLVANDLDYAKAAAIPLVQRYTFLDLFALMDDENTEEVIKQIKESDAKADEENMRQAFQMMSMPASSVLASMPSPRFVKSHLPMSLLNPKLLDTAKVVYVARDPRDVAVSCYHHAKLFQMTNFNGSFKEYWNLFYRNLIYITPYFEHVKEAWELKNNPNMLFLFYEELSKDLPAAIRRVAEFLGKELDQDQIDRLSDHLNIKNFKKNPSVNFEDAREQGMLAKGESFIRKGKAGGWRDHFDAEMTQQAERWILHNLQDADLRFPHM